MSSSDAKDPWSVEQLLKKVACSEGYHVGIQDAEIAQYNKDYKKYKWFSGASGHVFDPEECEIDWFEFPETATADGCKFEKVEDFGGEGMGDSVWMVFSVLFPDLTMVHYMKTGYHVSHEGTTWDGDLTVVKPKAVMKVEWE